MCIRLARSSIIWPLEAAGTSKDRFVSGLRGVSGSAEDQGLAQGEDALAGGYPGLVVKSQSIFAGHSS